jgi:hypothetical protein
LECGARPETKSSGGECPPKRRLGPLAMILSAEVPDLRTCRTPCGDFTP